MPRCVGGVPARIVGQVAFPDSRFTAKSTSASLPSRHPLPCSCPYSPLHARMAPVPVSVLVAPAPLTTPPRTPPPTAPTSTAVTAPAPGVVPAAPAAAVNPPYPYLTLPRPPTNFNISVQQASEEASASALLAIDAFLKAAAAATHAACMADKTAESYGNLSTALSGSFHESEAVVALAAAGAASLARTRATASAGSLTWANAIFRVADDVNFTPRALPIPQSIIDAHAAGAARPPPGASGNEGGQVRE